MKTKYGRVIEVFHTGRAEGILGALYLIVLTALLAAYLFMVLLRDEGYNPGMYRNAYVYFMVFDFILFSLWAPFWAAGSAAPARWEMLRAHVGVVIMALSPVPLILFIFMAGRLNPANFFVPILLKAVWGMALVSLVNCLNTVALGRRWKGFVTGIFIFSVAVLGGLLTFFYTEYRQAVITTLYDRDIAWFFFINPLLSLAGLVYNQAGGGSQLGLFPLYACTLFWGLTAVLLSLLTVRIGRGGAGRV